LSGREASRSRRSEISGGQAILPVNRWSDRQSCLSISGGQAILPVNQWRTGNPACQSVEDRQSCLSISGGQAILPVNQWRTGNPACQSVEDRQSCLSISGGQAILPVNQWRQAILPVYTRSGQSIVFLHKRTGKIACPPPKKNAALSSGVCFRFS